MLLECQLHNESLHRKVWCLHRWWSLPRIRNHPCKGTFDSSKHHLTPHLNSCPVTDSRTFPGKECIDQTLKDLLLRHSSQSDRDISFYAQFPLGSKIHKGN